jgi:YD repeat-containing protein
MIRYLITLLVILFFINSYSQTKTTYKYDAMQRITRVDFQDGGFETYTYDKVGNRKTFTKVVPIDPPSSVQNTDKQDIFKIYPNPTDRVFSIEGNLVSSSDAVLKVYDLSGREILSQSIPKSIHIKQELDISKYSTGNYVLVIHYGDRKRSWNVVKQ